jgi:hypothetical protein
MLANKLAPTAFTRWYKTTFLGSEDQDTFAAHYRCNTRRRLTRYLEEAGLSVEELQRSGNPDYWKLSTPTLFLSIYASRIAGRFGRWTLTHLTGAARRRGDDGA